MEERKGPGIWRHLYQFPLIESGEELFPGDLERHLLSEPGLPPVDSLSLYNDSPIVHKLSHQRLHAKFWVGRTDLVLEEGVRWGELQDFPVPVLIADFIKTFKI